MNIGFNGELVPHTGARAANVTGQRVDPSMIADIAKAQPQWGSLWKDVAQFGQQIFHMSEQMQEADFRVDALKAQEDYQHQMSSLSQDMTARQLNGEFDSPTEYFNAYEKGLTQIRQNVTNAAYGTADGAVKGYFRNKDINKERFGRMVESMQEASWRQGMAQYERDSIQYRNNQLDLSYKMGEAIGGARGAQIIAETVASDWRVPQEQKQFTAATRIIPLVAKEAWSEIEKLYDATMSLQNEQNIKNIYATDKDADNKVAALKADAKLANGALMIVLEERLGAKKEDLLAALPEDAPQAQRDALSALVDAQLEKLNELNKKAGEAQERWFDQCEKDADSADLKQFVDLENGRLPDGTILRPKTQKLKELTDENERKKKAKQEAEKAAKKAEAAEDLAQYRRYLIARLQGKEFTEELRENVKSMVAEAEFKAEVAKLSKEQAAAATAQWYRLLIAEAEGKEFDEELLDGVKEQYEEYRARKKLDETEKAAEEEAKKKAYEGSPAGLKMALKEAIFSAQINEGGLLDTKDGTIPIIGGAEKFYADCITSVDVVRRTETLLMLQIWRAGGFDEQVRLNEYLGIIQTADRLLPDQAAQRVANAVKIRVAGISGNVTDAQLSTRVETMQYSLYRAVNDLDSNAEIDSSDARSWLKTPGGRIAAQTFVDFCAIAKKAGSIEEVDRLLPEFNKMAKQAILVRKRGRRGLRLLTP